MCLIPFKHVKCTFLSKLQNVQQRHISNNGLDILVQRIISSNLLWYSIKTALKLTFWLVRNVLFGMYRPICFWCLMSDVLLWKSIKYNGICHHFNMWWDTWKISPLPWGRYLLENECTPKLHLGDPLWVNFTRNKKKVDSWKVCRDD